MSCSKPKVPGVVPNLLSPKCLEHIQWIKTVFEAEQYEIYMSDSNKEVLWCVLALNNGYLYLANPMKEFGRVLEAEDEPIGFTLCLEMQQPADAWNRATANGAVVLVDLGAQECGAMYGSFKDPFGFVWGLCKVEGDSCKPGVIPYILHDGDCEKHIQWIVSALGGEVKAKESKDGKVRHCELDINGSAVCIADGTHPALQHLAKNGKVTHLLCHMNLPDPQPVWDKLMQNGAESMVDLKVQFWGGTYGAARDVMGVEWSVTKYESCEGKYTYPGVTPYVLSPDCEKHIDWIQKVFGAEVKELYRTEAKKIMHCQLSINGGHLFICDRCCDVQEEGKEQEGKEVSSEGTVLQLSLADPDSVWQKALSNKGEQVVELKRQFWGGYYGCVRDPFGFKWGICKDCE